MTFSLSALFSPRLQLETLVFNLVARSEAASSTLAAACRSDSHLLCSTETDWTLRSAVWAHTATKTNKKDLLGNGRSFVWQILTQSLLTEATLPTEEEHEMDWKAPEKDHQWPLS